MRWSAPGVSPPRSPSGCSLPATTPLAALRRRAVAADPASLPAGAAGSPPTLRLAELAVTVALRRHGRPADAVGARPGRCADVRLVVGSGGVLRHAAPSAPATGAGAGHERPRRRLAGAGAGRGRLRRRRYVLFARRAAGGSRAPGGRAALAGASCRK